MYLIQEGYHIEVRLGLSKYVIIERSDWFYVPYPGRISYRDQTGFMYLIQVEYHIEIKLVLCTLSRKDII